MSYVLCTCKRRNADKILLYRYLKAEVEKKIIEKKYNKIKPEMIQFILGDIEYGAILDALNIKQDCCRMEILTYITDDESVV
jgi:DNA-directed RNA polymerase subunit N (RpoN/RPB10)